MNNRLMLLKVRGRCKSYAFEVYADPAYLDGWRKDGLDINLVENTWPEWVADAGLTEVWCFFQDLFHFKWLRKK